MSAEAKLLEACKRRLKALGPQVWFFKVHAAGFSAAGVPDLVAVIAGRTVWFELKAPGAETTRLQTLMHERMRAAGARVHVVWTIEEFSRLIEEYTGTLSPL